eukprot:s3120_g10.t3
MRNMEEGASRTRNKSNGQRQPSNKRVSEPILPQRRASWGSKERPATAATARQNGTPGRRKVHENLGVPSPAGVHRVARQILASSPTQDVVHINLQHPITSYISPSETSVSSKDEVSTNRPDEAELLRAELVELKRSFQVFGCHMEKNYSYLAIQLQKFCHSYGRRQLEIAFLQLAEHALKVSSAQAQLEDVEPRTAAAMASQVEPLEQLEPEPFRAAPAPPQSSRSRRARAVEENFQLGFQTLCSILALQLRYSLRRWENFARRKQFEERQSKVVHALRSLGVNSRCSLTYGVCCQHCVPISKCPGNVQAELDGKGRLHPLHPSPLGHSPERSPSAVLSPGSPLAEATPQFRAHAVHGASEALRSELLAHHGYGMLGLQEGSPKKSHGFQSDDDFVKLCEDQARIDEAPWGGLEAVIKLAAILWDNASLANMQPAALPLVLLKASLLARMAERCQRHVMKEALHLLWKRCTLQRSMEELISQGFVKREALQPSSRHASVTQGPPADHHHLSQAPAAHSEASPAHEAAHFPAAHAAHQAHEESREAEVLQTHEGQEAQAESRAESVDPEAVDPDPARRLSMATSETSADLSERRASAASVGWDALADAVGGRPKPDATVHQPVASAPAAVAAPAAAPAMALASARTSAPASARTSAPVSARPGPTVIAMAGLESEEPSEAESDIDDDALAREAQLVQQVESLCSQLAAASCARDAAEAELRTLRGELASQTACTAQMSPSPAAGGMDEELILGQDMSGGSGGRPSRLIRRRHGRELQRLASAFSALELDSQERQMAAERSCAAHVKHLEELIRSSQRHLALVCQQQQFCSDLQALWAEVSRQRASPAAAAPAAPVEALNGARPRARTGEERMNDLAANALLRNIYSAVWSWFYLLPPTGGRCRRFHATGVARSASVPCATGRRSGGEPRDIAEEGPLAAKQPQGKLQVVDLLVVAVLFPLELCCWLWERNLGTLQPWIWYQRLASFLLFRYYFKSVSILDPCGVLEGKLGRRLIFCSNHPTGLLDRLLVQHLCPWYTNAVERCLHVTQGMTFDHVVETLRKDAAVWVAVGGAREMHPHIRKVHTGAVRIAMQCGDVWLVPMHLAFEAHCQRGSDVLVELGQPLLVSREDTESPAGRERVRSLTREVEERLLPLTNWMPVSQDDFGKKGWRGAGETRVAIEE